MRRIAVALAGVAAALALTACGSSSQSYSDGYSTGRSMAAARGDARLGPHALHAACARQWQVSGAALDSQGPWIRGCTAGFTALERSLGG